MDILFENYEKIQLGIMGLEQALAEYSVSFAIKDDLSINHKGLRMTIEKYDTLVAEQTKELKQFLDLSVLNERPNKDPYNVSMHIVNFGHAKVFSAQLASFNHLKDVALALINL